MRFADVKEKEFIGSDWAPIKKVVDLMSDYSAINAEVTITMGYTKNESLNKETVKDTIDDIYNNKHIINKAEISLKENDDTNVEIIDLFEDKMHDFIFFTLERRESLGTEYVAARMAVTYNNRKGEIIECKRERL